MKKKVVLVLTSASTLTISALAMFLVPKMNESAKANPPTYTISLDSSVNLVEKDKGYLRQASVKNNKFDVIGYGENAGGFCTIAKQSHDLTTRNGVETDAYTFEGMVYNRSVINGFTSLTVTFSGGPGSLYYKLTDFLMEDMNFSDTSHPLTSGTEVSVSGGEAYFVVYTQSPTPVAIQSIDIEYECNGNIDREMIYNKNTSLGGARSVSKRTTKEDSFIELENNPLVTNNNHSTGTHTDGMSNRWHRFNGRFFTASEDLGTEFTFGMTIIGNISQVLDETDYFHYNVWPQFTYGGTYYDEDEGKDLPDDPWVQTYIGNDNYEPLGKDSEDLLNPTDPYVKESYSGRFFTNYDWYDKDFNIDYESSGKWMFADPDIAKIPDGSKTFRQAYQENDLPFWYLEFHVYLNGEDEPCCDIEINGTMIYSSEIFQNYDKVNKPAISIITMPMHLVNYAHDDSASPAASYVGSFTYPRLIN